MQTSFTCALLLVSATQAVKMAMLKQDKECPSGQYWRNKNIGCEDCPVGNFCPVGTKKHPEPCPEGTYQDMTGAAMAADCKLCPIGQYTDHAGAFECYECPAGFYCPDMGVAAPFLCPVNSFCEAGSVAPTDCPPEQHNDFAGADSADDCFMTEPIICPAGQYAMGLTDCVDCVAGMFCEDQGIVEPTGMCPIGFYCPEGTAEPVPCPEGFTTEIDGAAAVSECVEEFVCPDGMIIMGEECTMCPAGFFCEIGIDDPEWCPMGFYCPAGSVTPVECPEGTTSTMTGLMDATECVPVEEVEGEVIEDDGTAADEDKEDGSGLFNHDEEDGSDEESKEEDGSEEEPKEEDDSAEEVVVEEK